MKTLIAALALIVAGSANAEIYKCTVDGKTSFSEAPCINAKAGGAIKLKIDEPSAKPMPPIANAGATTSAAGSLSDKDKADQDFRVRHRLRAIEEDITRAQTQIRSLNSQMENEMDNLRASKRISNNNLAGATRDVSISGEMEAVASKYTNKIKSVEVEIETLRQERTKLQK